MLKNVVFIEHFGIGKTKREHFDGLMCQFEDKLG